MKHVTHLTGVIAFLILFLSCEQPTSFVSDDNGGGTSGLLKQARNPTSDYLAALMDEINAEMAVQGLNYRVGIAEYMTGGGEEMGATVLSRVVGNKQLTADFVPSDPRRSSWSGPVGSGPDDITYAIDQTGDAVPPGGGLTAAQTTAAIDRAMGTWQAQTCSNLPIVKNSDQGADIGLIAYLNGLGGSSAIVADVQHAGWRDINFAGGILGVTFTFIWIDGDGNPTDIDNNHKLDVALREIYYDPSWIWADDGISNIDVETVALHEAGHGLSQAHFGTLLQLNDGSLQAAPRAVMNAFYLDPQRELFGTDLSGHCSLWANWPQ